MPRGGQESWRDKFLRETKGNKVHGGGTNPFATPIKKAKAKAKPKAKPKRRTKKA